MVARLGWVAGWAICWVGVSNLGLGLAWVGLGCLGRAWVGQFVGLGLGLAWLAGGLAWAWVGVGLVWPLPSAMAAFPDGLDPGPTGRPRGQRAGPSPGGCIRTGPGH